MRGTFGRIVKSSIALLLVLATLVGQVAITAEAVSVSTGARIYSDFKSSPAYKKYKDFANLYVSKYAIPVPGLAHTDVSGTDCTTMVPQGICFADDYMVVSAYDSEGSCNSVLYVISNTDGKNRQYLMTLVLPTKAHVGGVAFDGTYLWVSNGKSVSSIKYSTLDSTVASAVSAKKKSVSVKFHSTCSLSTTASFLTYNDGMLWVGEFKEKGDDSGKMYSYTISSDAKKLTQKYYITLPDRIQGACFKDGYLILSRSYSRNVSGSTYISQLRIYKVSEPSSNGNIKKNSVVKTITLPPMVEGIVAGSSYMYLLFESAATKYYKGTDGKGKCEYPVDRIIPFRFSDFIDITKTEDTKTENVVYFPVCDESIDTISKALSSLGYDSSLETRKVIAAANNIDSYSGTYDQNEQMLSMLKSGKLVNPGLEKVPVTEETNPEQTVPEETVPEETVPEETVPEETVPEETVPEETVPEETVPEETVPEETVPEETVPEETVPEETVPEDTVPEETVPEDTADSKYFAKCDPSFESIANALVSIGVDGSKAYRTKIAEANGIANYTGTAEQNIQMLDLLIEGKLLKPELILKENEYLICFDANGGSGEMAELVLSNGSKLPANAFTKKGYTFQGWATSATGEVVLSDEAVLALEESVILYPVWKANTFTLTFNANGGSGKMADVTVTYDVYTALPTPGFTRSGYVLAGWYRYRTSDNKWIYESSDGSTRGWYVEGEQPSGYKKIVQKSTSGVSKTSAVNGDTVIMYAVWEKDESYVSLDGKTVMFIGNSFVYYGGVVEHGGQKKTDQGWFYEICKANGEKVKVIDCTYGSHHLYDFTSKGCKSGSCHKGKDLLAGVDLESVDYVFFSESGNDNSNFLKDAKAVMNRFPSSTKFFYLAHSYTYSKNHKNIINKLDDLEKLGVGIIVWGDLVDDVIDGRVSVPGATQKYKKTTFIKNDGDNYHPNPLAGYITAQMCYCAVTGKPAVGQMPDVYKIGDTLKYGKSAVGYSKYISVHYKSSSNTNFKAVLKSKDDIKGLQKLMDKYLAKWDLGANAKK